MATVGSLAVGLAFATRIGLEALDEREAQSQMTLAQQAQFSITPEREQAVDFSSSYYDVAQAIIAMVTQVTNLTARCP